MKRKSSKLTKLFLGLIVIALAVLATALLMPVTAYAEGETKIYTAKDMQLIADNPSGSFILMNDIDMKDVDWTPVDFTGVFDGNNHAILNLSVNKTSEAIRTTYDGNYKTYDTCFAGLFGALENAEVKNLTLLGEKVTIEKDAPCFIGTIAGFAEGSKIDNCNIVAECRLDVSCKMFGVGGIVGYGGSGSITNTKNNVTLICIDHDKENRDEQFMGGAYSAGFIDVDKCSIKIDGYDSDHGYVHNGGLVGMYILYPLGNTYAGYINNTRVEGMITFFEDNTDRRAYCKDFMGEVMNWTYEYVGNSSDFKPNEIKDYSKDLLPHYCEAGNYDSKVVESTCEEFGYTEYTCKDCSAYTYRADYTLKNHQLGNYEIIEDSTEEKEGLQKGICSVCGEEVYEIIPVKEPEVAEPEIEVEMPEEDVDTSKEKKEGSSDVLLGVFLILGALISAGLVGGIIFVVLKGKKR